MTLGAGVLGGGTLGTPNAIATGAATAAAGQAVGSFQVLNYMPMSTRNAVVNALSAMIADLWLQRADTSVIAHVSSMAWNAASGGTAGLSAYTPNPGETSTDAVTAGYLGGFGSPVISLVVPTDITGNGTFPNLNAGDTVTFDPPTYDLVLSLSR